MATATTLDGVERVIGLLRSRGYCVDEFAARRQVGRWQMHCDIIGPTRERELLAARLARLPAVLTARCW